MEAYLMGFGLAGSEMDARVIHGHGPGFGTVNNEAASNGVGQLATTLSPRTASTTRHIPLVCSICPKNSKFSDVSHLLTHISSKGHLSNKFHMEIAQDTDQYARKALEEYEAWFEEHGIRELLQNRSDHRQKRGDRAQGRAGGNAGSSNIGMRGGIMVSRGNIGTGTSNRGKRVSGLLGGVNSILKSPGQSLTGMLGQHRRGHTQAITHLEYVKCEPENDQNSLLDYTSSSHGPQFHRRQIAHGMQDPNDQAFQYFDGLHAPNLHHEQVGFPNSRQQAGTIEKDDAGYDDGEMSSKYHPSEEEDDNDDEDHEGYDMSPLLSENTVDTTLMDPEMNSDDEETREAAHNAKYLKGPQYKGMGVFDAASVEDRKKRNQKKDPSVAAGLQVASENVKSTEYVMNSDMDVQRERDVGDPPSVDGSEDDEDEPSSGRKRKRRSPKTTRGRGKPKKTRGAPKSSRTFRERTTAVTGRGTRRRGGPRGPRGPRGSSTRMSSSRASNEMASQVPAPVIRATRSRRGSTISTGRLQLSGHSHGDNGGVDVTRDTTDPSPGQTECPVPQRLQNNISGLALRPGNSNICLPSPTPVLKRRPRLYGGKENHNLSFPTQPTTSNPYLNSHSSLGESSFNPLRAQPRENVGFRLYSSYDEDTKPPNPGFQPVNSHAGYTSLYMSSNNGDVYQSDQRHNGGVYDI